MGLNRAVQERLEAMNITDPLTRQIHIKMSGCPNGCSQHHIANIGFYGASMKVGDKAIPAYIAHIGGNYEGGEVVYGHRLKARLPAKRVPDAVERWVRFYEAERNDGRGRSTTSPSGSAPTRFEEQVKDLAMPVEFSAREHGQFIDWNRPSPTRSSAARGSARSEHGPTPIDRRDPRAARSPHRPTFESTPRPIADDLEDASRRGGAALGARHLPPEASTSPARSRRPAR